MHVTAAIDLPTGVTSTRQSFLAFRSTRSSAAHIYAQMEYPNQKHDQGQELHLAL